VSTTAAMRSTVRSTSGRVTGNAVLDRLPAADRTALLARAERVPIARGDVLCIARRPLGAIHFPLGGLVALVAPVTPRPPLAVGLVGRDGMVGLLFARDDDAGALGAVVQADGHAWRVAADDFAPALVRRPWIRRAVELAERDVVAQLACTASCLLFHEIEERLAGWLALAATRSPERLLHLTHQQLADLLGVQRSAITLATGSLQRHRLLDCTRGEIRILDRAGLEAVGCACHRGVRARATSRAAR
jgi:CRP-like cAMP-binding protein